MYFSLILLFTQLLFVTVEGTISKNFYEFVQKQHGDAIAQKIARKDFGVNGSFGGGNHKAGVKTKKVPVVFIHGYMDYAGKVAPIAEYFKEHFGYSDEELYATSYGTSALTMPIHTGMNCEYVKMARVLIQSVVVYTNSSVNVAGYSMGSPIGRKAILGGNCTDTGENLGASLSALINAFIGVAGANYGAKTCLVPAGVCSLINGMYCGSKFLNDINSKKHYEGRKVYVVSSVDDDIVGYKACGKVASDISGADQTTTLKGLNHYQTISAQTAEEQHKLLVQAGENNSGSNNSGSNNSESKNSGSNNSGSKNSGSNNSGSKNSGSNNSGSKNSESSNSGSNNSGSKNSGSNNSGSNNSGSSNSGSKGKTTKTPTKWLIL